MAWNGFIVTGYDAITDMVRTGGDPKGSFGKWPAVEPAFEMSRRIDLAVAGPDDAADDIKVTVGA